MRLREDSAQQSMLFDFGNNRNGNILTKSHAGGSLKSAVKLNQVQLDVRKSAKVIRPGSSESAESVGHKSAKKTSYISGILNSAKKAAGRVTPY